MIVADTNVLSEPLRPQPDHRVVGWLREHHADLAITAITAGELRYGVRRLPAGRRRDALAAAVEDLIASAGDRLLAYDGAASLAYARLRADLEARGRVIGPEDLMIAAICVSSGCAIATRNVRHFADAGLVIHDPWSA